MRFNFAAIVALAIMPAIAAAQQTDTARQSQAQEGDTTAVKEVYPQEGQGQIAPQGQQGQQQEGQAQAQQDSAVGVAREVYPVPAEGGETVLDRHNYGLNHEQVRQLQTKLREIDCYDSEPDGLFGVRTRQGMACAARHHNVDSADPNAIFQALNLDFSVETEAGAIAPQQQPDTGAAIQSDTGAVRSGEVSPQSDTASAPTSADTLRPTTAEDTAAAEDSAAARDSAAWEDTTSRHGAVLHYPPIGGEGYPVEAAETEATGGMETAPTEESGEIDPGTTSDDPELPSESDTGSSADPADESGTEPSADSDTRSGAAVDSLSMDEPPR